MRIFPFILVVLFFILAGSVSSPAQNAASVEPLLLYKAQQDKNCRHWVDSVMDKLSFKEKVGQLFIYTIAPVDTKRNLELLREIWSYCVRLLILIKSAGFSFPVGRCRIRLS